eukprot:9614-Heterococcus_DN1.PRE.1
MMRSSRNTSTSTRRDYSSSVTTVAAAAGSRSEGMHAHKGHVQQCYYSSALQKHAELQLQQQQCTMDSASMHTSPDRRLTCTRLASSCNLQAQQTAHDSSINSGVSSAVAELSAPL